MTHNVGIPPHPTLEVAQALSDESYNIVIRNLLYDGSYTPSSCSRMERSDL